MRPLPAAGGPHVVDPSTNTPSPTGQLEEVLFELRRLIVGQDRLLECLLVALLARGHVLLEGVPGLAKTATIKALAKVVGGTFGRVQFTARTWSRPTCWARAFTPAPKAVSLLSSARCSPTCCSRMKSIAPRPKSSRRFSK